MAAEADLVHQLLPLGPFQQFGPRTLKGPLQVVGAVEAMDGEVVEPLQPQVLKGLLQLAPALLDPHAGQQFAGDAERLAGHRQSTQGPPQVPLGRPVGRRRLEVVPPGGQVAGHDRFQLVLVVQGPHGAEGEERDRRRTAERTAHGALMARRHLRHPRRLPWRPRAGSDPVGPCPGGGSGPPG